MSDETEEQPASLPEAAIVATEPPDDVDRLIDVAVRLRRKLGVTPQQALDFALRLWKR